MTYKFKATSENIDSIIGTHNVGQFVTTKHNLIKTFGLPSEDEYADKVRYEWIIQSINTQTGEEIISTIYDYKNYRDDIHLDVIEDDEIFQWNIGGHNRESVYAVLEAMRNRKQSFAAVTVA